MVILFNKSMVQKPVEGTDGEMYFIPPRKRTSLPEGVEPKSLPDEIKILKS